MNPKLIRPILSSFIFLIFSTYAMDENTKQKFNKDSSNTTGQPVMVTIYNSGHNVEAISSAQASAQTDLKITWQQFTKMSMEQAKQTKDDITNLSALLQNFLVYYKYRICFLSLGTLYLKTRYSLYVDHYYFEDKNRWANWLPEESLHDFYDIPNTILENKLIHEIYYRYLNKNNPTDVIMPLVEFVKNLNEELLRLTNYQKRAHWIKMLKVSFLFPAQEVINNKVSKKIERLLFLKHIFISWSTTQQQFQKQLT